MAYAWAPYEPATSCDAIPAGAKALAAYLLDYFAYMRSRGICHCRNVQGSSSLSHHAECRAFDAGIPTGPNRIYIPTLGDPIHELLGPYGKRLGLDHLILNRTIYSAISPDGRYYSGVHPHNNHAHIGLTKAAAINLNYATLVHVLGVPKGIGLPNGGDDLLPLKYRDGFSTGRPEKKEDVRLLQELLEIDPDGLYGNDTAGAVAAFSGDDGKLVNGSTYAAIQAAAYGGSHDPHPPQTHKHPQYLIGVEGKK